MPVLAVGGVAIAALAAALIALLFILAAPSLVSFFDATLGRLPVIGSAVAGAVATGINTAAAGVEAVFDNALHGFAEYVWAQGVGLWIQVSQIVGHLNTVTTAIFTLTTQIAVQAQNALSDTQNYYNQAIGFATGAVNGLRTYVEDADSVIMDAIGQAQAYAIGVTENYYNLAIGFATQEYNDAIGIVQDYYNEAIAFATSYTDGLRTFVNDAISVLQDSIGTVESTALGWVQNYYNLAIAYINQEIGVVEGDIGTLATRVGVDLSNVLGQAEAFTSAAANALGTEITSVADRAAAATAAAASAAVATAEGAAASGLKSAIDAIEATITPDVVGPWDILLPQLTIIEGAIGAEAAAALGLGEAIATVDPSTVAGVLDVVVPALGAIATEVAECSVPMCTNLGGLSNLLGELLSGVALAGLLAFVAEAATDPQAAVSDVNAVVVGPINDTASALRELIGV